MSNTVFIKYSAHKSKVRTFFLP